ncbi:hypothetical protein [Marinifilum flexuosum]|uniref:Bacteriophage CI repressor-like protein n=1 Tax=Marinifilum flexuosum TaxID=1117708 RepID=A0A419XA65_9BACT|nr:hypothetical protein [Marinifilum flexuosum]RKE04648.1 hypothetical protein BXY64_1675 [Marinifilum flexuosum]
MNKHQKNNTPVKINELIREEMERQMIGPLALSEKLNIGTSSVYNFLEKSSLQVSRLWTISEALQYNFFKRLADQIDIKNPIDSRIAELENEINDLKKERDTLKEVIALLGGNR